MQIKYLARQGMQKTKIADWLGISRQTVYNHLDRVEPYPKPRENRPSKLDPFGDYIRARLEGTYTLGYDGASMHECVFSDRALATHGVSTLDVAKRLLDYGFYAPTIYFPLVVRGALMIEPTETESKETLDEFCEAMLAIAAEAAREPDLVRGAPHETFRGRLDETGAARRPRLRWHPEDNPMESRGN